MTTPTATIGTDTPNAARMTRAMNQSNNPEYVFIGNANIVRTPEFYVRIFNVGDMEHRIERPWVSYNPAQGGKIIIIPACEEGKPYSKPFVIADVVQMPVRNLTSGEMDTRGVDGKFLAQDALNPEDPRGNWRTVRALNQAASLNEGTNLYHWGVFWTVNEVPSAEELKAANGRRDAYYNRLIEEAKALWMAGTEGRRQIGNTHRRAASYFHLEFEWNQLYRPTMDCPGCGSRVPQNAAICPNCPATFDWTRAMTLGLRTKQQAIDAGIIEGQAADMAEAAKPKPKKG